MMKSLPAPFIFVKRIVFAPPQFICTLLYRNFPPCKCEKLLDTLQKMRFPRAGFRAFDFPHKRSYNTGRIFQYII